MIKIGFKNLFKNHFKKKYKKDLSIIIYPPLVMGTLSLLEKTIVSTILKENKINKIFEFGTFFGSTTSIMALNSKATCKVFSIDLPTEKKFKNFSFKEFEKIKKKYNVQKQDENDKFLQIAYKKFGPFYIKFLNKKFKKKIKLLKGDSLYYNFDNYKNSFDMIFIDGGHNYKTIRQDTRNSINMVKNNGIIMWHDISSNVHTNVTKFLKTLNLKMYHFEHTMLCYTIIKK